MTGRGRVERADVTQRRTAALRLRIEGVSVDDIRDQLGYSSSARVSEDITRALAQRTEQQAVMADQLRQLELDRLDALYLAVWAVLLRKHPYVSGGKVVEITNEVTGEKAQLMDDGPTLAAVDRLVRIGESRRKLLGLDAPVRVEASGTVRYVVDGVNMGELT